MATIQKENFKLNYIIGGRNQKLVNVNYELNDGTKFVNKSFFTDSDTNNSLRFTGLENSHRILRHYTNGKTAIIHALFYDSKTALKQPTMMKTMRKQNKYDSIEAALDEVYILSDDSYRDVYSSNINQTNIKYCQVVTRIEGLSPETHTTPYIKTTTLAETRDHRLNTSIASLDWDFKLQADDLNLYLYCPLKYAKRYLTAEEEILARTTGATFDLSISSYFDYIKSRPEQMYDALDDLFYPRFNLSVFPVNYIYAIPTCLANNMDNNYNAGYIFGKYFTGKNMYDALYSMNYSINYEQKIGTLSNTRNYFDIGATSKKLYLKYYDENSYESLPNQDLKTSLDKDNKEIKNIKIAKQTNSKKHPYQKIETFEAENIFRNGHNFSEHPTTLYSIVVNGLFTDADSIANEHNKGEFVKNIKMDIRHRISDIARKFAPATTELFDVYFDR